MLPGAVVGEFVVAAGGHCCCRLEGRGAPGLGAEKQGKKGGKIRIFLGLEEKKKREWKEKRRENETEGKGRDER